MAETLLPPKTGPGSAAAQPVAQNNKAIQPASAPVGPSAASRAVEFGGNKGGKPRGDGLVPGSEAAKVADREKERLKKAAQRAAARAANPPTLPPALPPAPKPESPGNPIQPPNGVQSDGAPGPFIPWNPDEIREVTDEVINAVEDHRVSKRGQKATEANLSAVLVREIQAGTKFPPAARGTLQKTLPRIIAKWANKAGWSAEYMDEGFCLVALLRIVSHDSKLEAKLDQLIQQNQQQLAASKAAGAVVKL